MIKAREPIQVETMAVVAGMPEKRRGEAFQFKFAQSSV